MTDTAIDISELRKLSPLNGLKRENIVALVDKTEVKEVQAGSYLFQKGDARPVSVYLLGGSVEYVDGDKVVGQVEAGTSKGKHPLSPALPRAVSARASSRVRYIEIDSEILDVMLTWDQTGTYEVTEIQQGIEAASEDWMTNLLRTRAFHRIPAANIQAIFMRMQQVNVREGDVIIRQGDEGDYFYVITKGQAGVTRETPLNKEGIKLAELGVGDTFGEEALISEAKRNATVTMLMDGSVMRLGKDDFKTLLNEPMLDWVSSERASEIIAGGGQWLDVRLPSEFQNYHPDDAVNIPLYFLRMRLSSLDQEIPYVVICDTGRRSSAAAYLLSERGYNASVLEGGLSMSDGDRTG
jgi:CRP-like cAMP-binding protein